jgi:four helix bundle protein
MIRTFRDLHVWQKSHQLVLGIYRATRDFPNEERYGLVSNLRRSAVSVPTNIVEGFKRHSRKEYAYFIRIADSSLEETKYHILLAKDLGYLKEESFEETMKLCDEIGRMLWGFYRSLTI